VSILGRARERRFTLQTNNELARSAFGGLYMQTSSGAYVGPEAAMRHVDVYACVRAITDEVASLPMLHYRSSRTATSRAHRPDPPRAPYAVLSRRRRC
jgi:phage portal protein BeeE